MKKNLCFFVATMLFTIVTSAQDITIDSVAILDSIKHAGTRVQIRYVPIPKEKPKPNEFFSIQLGAFIVPLYESNDYTFEKERIEKIKQANQEIDEDFSARLEDFSARFDLTPYELELLKDVRLGLYHIVNEEGVYIHLFGEFNELNDAISTKQWILDLEMENIYVVKVIDKRKIVIIE